VTKLLPQDRIRLSTSQLPKGVGSVTHQLGQMGGKLAI